MNGSSDPAEIPVVHLLSQDLCWGLMTCQSPWGWLLEGGDISRPKVFGHLPFFRRSYDAADLFGRFLASSMSLIVCHRKDSPICP